MSADAQQQTEAARLLALKSYQILDTPPEAVYDRAVRLASAFFKAPMALVSLVDAERQWFKACYGLDFRETSRSVSFCAHALEQDGVLVVPDARQDPRFVDNPLVTGELHIRFYAGAPLVTPDGQKLGTLCILDQQPRAPLTPDECQMLQHLADSVVSELELRRTLARLTHQEAVHAAVLNSSLDAVIVMDEHGKVTEWNPAAERLFGYRREELIGQELAAHIIPPEWRDAHQRGLAHYLRTGEGPVLGRRLHLTALRRTGETFPCELAITALDLPNERLFTASLRDLTDVEAAQSALESSNRLLRAVVDTVPEAIFVKDQARRYTMINEAGAAQIGRLVEDILGRTDDELFGAEVASASRLRDEQVLEQAQGITYEVTDQLPDGARRTFWSSKLPAWGPDGTLTGLIGVAIDITERKVSETTIQEHNTLLRSRVEAAQVEVLERLARAAEYRDDDTGEHMTRVGETAAGIAAQLGLSPEEVQLLRRAAPMHDVGKIGVSDSILLKPGRLTPDEFEVVKTHCLIGSNILSGGQSPLVVLAEEIARTHHERWDGSGYPAGLCGEQIPISGRIVAVADVLDALMSERPYKRAWSQAAALAEIQTQAGQHFDPQVVRALEHVLNESGPPLADPAEEAAVPKTVH
ncbi:PAS domain S-box protein [Deinococcus arboris]|nr:PAS domain S-box protein [Deinococcus arboris]